MPINENGPVFAAFAEDKNISPQTLQCAKDVVESLGNVAANAAPGLLFGKIQSGKTRTFITALALAFDNGFDLAIVFTKGVKVLTQQTVSRIGSEFAIASDRDLVHVFEVMSTPENLPPALIAQKLIIVCKKEDDNINRLRRLLAEVYPSLINRKCLIIDDEADFASVGYRRDGGAIVSAVIPGQMDRLRQTLQDSTVLQVTATPYSLYLQPRVMPAQTGLTFPIRPSFTHLVPWGPEYVGGERYFERSQIPGTYEELFHITVPPAEMDSLRSADRAGFQIEDSLTAPEIDTFRRAIVTFLLGGFIRRWQAQQQGEAVLPRYAFIVHSETAKASHLWQVNLTERIRDTLRANGANHPLLQDLVQTALTDLSESVDRIGFQVPSLNDAIVGVYSALESFMVHKVNSETQIRELLNPTTGELNLLAHYNVFVGGNILDRGVTVPKLIGFFYGRRPKTSQQDTVLQHCRMYGYRPVADLAVTRFYTTAGIYSSMLTIHQFDQALRVDIEAGRQPGGVYFLRADRNGRIRATSPQRVLASHLETVVPGTQKLILPLGFDVRADVIGQRATNWIDALLQAQFGDQNDRGPRYGQIPAATAADILEHIRRALDLSATDPWDARGHAALLRYLAQHGGRSGNVAVCVLRGGNQTRVRPDRRLQNYFVFPRDVDEARGHLNGRPGLLLARQNPGAGFRPMPFWWPMILLPVGIQPHVFALN
jgi:hypothetical protein